eukprot:SAG31_NODE_336_length_17493_cov_20.694032_12_plen_253_part_00
MRKSWFFYGKGYSARMCILGEYTDERTQTTEFIPCDEVESGGIKYEYRMDIVWYLAILFIYGANITGAIRRIHKSVVSSSTAAQVTTKPSVASVVFGALDHGMVDKKSKSLSRRSIRSEVKSSVYNIDESKKALTKSRGFGNKCIRFVRQALGALLTLVVIAGSAAVVTVCVTNSKQVQQELGGFSFAPTVIISAIQQIVPYIVSIVIVQWVMKPLTDNEEFLASSVRIYFIKLLTYLILFYQIHSEKGPTG